MQEIYAATHKAQQKHSIKNGVKPMKRTGYALFRNKNMNLQHKNQTRAIKIQQ